MAITTLPITVPPTSSTPQDEKNLNGSSANAATNNNNAVPRTPVSPTMSSPQQQQAQQQQTSPSQQTNAQVQQAQMKRKPSRRANTAERRATHNAVERQRRETLNGRFLDLAALLPNLSQIRRPSKSSIVNSSIAHIHASRRHRNIASRELRLLKLEADALRREVNEWRERAGIARVEEPVRGEGFGMVISGELDLIVSSVGPGGLAEEDEDDELVGPEDQLPPPGSSNGLPGHHPQQVPGYPHNQYDGYENSEDFAGLDGLDGMPGLEDPRMMAMLKSQGHPDPTHGNPFSHNLPSAGPSGGSLPTLLPRPTVGSNATNIPAHVYDGMYDHPHMQHSQHLQQQQYVQHQHARDRDHHMMPHRQDQDKAWNGMMYPAPGSNPNGPSPTARIPPQQQGGPFNQSFPSYSQQQQQQQMMIQAQRSLFTPPATSHGLPTPSPTSSGVAPGTSPSPPLLIDQQSHSQVSALRGGARERSGSVHSHHSAGSRGSHSPAYELGLGDYLGNTSGAPVSSHGEYGVGMGIGGVPRMMSGVSAAPDMLASPVSAGGLGVGIGVGMN